MDAPAQADVFTSKNMSKTSKIVYRYVTTISKDHTSKVLGQDVSIHPIFGL